MLEKNDFTEKKHGFRKIFVDGKTYNWCFGGIIDVRLSSCPKGQALEIDFGWYDIWLYVNDPVKPPEFEPKIVTPKFVERGIKFANQCNWEPDNKTGVFGIFYRKGEFSTKQ